MLDNIRELNFSKIKTYRFCPYCYKLKYIYGKREGLVAVTSLGVSIHKTLEEYHRADTTPDNLLSFYNRCFLGGGYESAGEQMEYYLKGKRMMEVYAKRDAQRNSKVQFCETEFKFDYEGWVFRGRVDRVDLLPDGSCCVIDYKTDAEIPEDFDPKQSLQLALYALGAKRYWMQKVGKACIHFIAHDKICEADFNCFNDEEILNSCISTGLEIENKKFEPNFNSCEYCLSKRFCKYANQKQEDKQKGNFNL